MADLLAVPAERRSAIERLAKEFRAGRSVAISTHINSDGDGCGSEVALARLLAQLGIEARIANPTPWPAMFDFLLGGDVRNDSDDAEKALRGADMIVVLDISDLRRLGPLGPVVRASDATKIVIDHHIPSDVAITELALCDTSACATGELIFDLASVLGLELTGPVAEALYVALLTDTGGFRFSNTTARCHTVAGALLAAGVDPEAMYRRIYASVPIGRLHLLRDALATLEVDPEYGIAWISVEAGAPETHGLKSEDLDGIAEHPRSVAGTKLAIFFRDLGHGKVKASFRSAGEVDVNAFAREFGGGGHAKASGAMIPGTLEEVRHDVVAAARLFLEKHGVVGS
ncbi:MAG TPA: bifunctional oligoribonuclease/PAP phosphatase NrnA [Gemmatimonadaceae bacterium]|nr:bifunctional oligoribonuclease/PAP phosphatase NrnA [Gemmatimonadaceae bacterium]